MRAALHLLLMACVLWCAIGVAEPGEASVHVGRAHATAGAEPSAPVPATDAPDPVGGGHHHHCPVAPDVAPAGMGGRVAAPAVGPVMTPAWPLDAVGRAPPLQPPSAA